ncbi:MAG: hypothetical protein AAF790_14385, partial [Planctomycetota bacterium]
EVRQSLGDALGGLASSEQWTSRSGCRVMGLVATGEAKGVPLEWRYYLVMPPATPESGDDAGPRHMVSIVTTVEPALAAVVGKADRLLADRLELATPVKQSPGLTRYKPRVQRRGTARTASRPKPATQRRRGPARRRR